MTRKLLILLLFAAASMESQNLEWNTNMTDAITLSNEQRKPLLILFTALNAPENFQNEVLKTLDFEKWSRKNVILVKLDISDTALSSEVREQNIKLKNAFAVENLPQVCFANASIRKGKTNFDVIGKLFYTTGGVKTWLNDSNLILNPE